MKFISTTGKGPEVSFRNAVVGNLPDDGGLFFPKSIPKLGKDFVDDIAGMALHDIASHALAHFCSTDIEQHLLDEICKRVYNFPIPLNEVATGIQCLELFHGPTFAFKDIGAKFLAECLAHFNVSDSLETTVLVATSGDTGGAVASGFLGVEGVRVIILYPKGKVSELQEKQLTTLGQNITALEVKGTFDDCQHLVKTAFADKEINNRMRLSSANSINIARWLPQSVYYHIPFQKGMKDIIVSVPSGNYGNLTAGVLAMKMGIPISRFIAASNANDVVPRYLRSASYNPKDTIATIANAMDVSDPSNFKRLQSLFDNSYEEIRNVINPFSLHDEHIKTTIKVCFEQNKYLLDPHSAIAYEALKQNGESGIFLGTAHYCKFLPTMNDATKKKIPIPDFANYLIEKKKDAILMDTDDALFKDFLINL